MRYVLKQKIWTLGSSFAIKNDAGVELGTVSGSVRHANEHMTFVDTQGTVYATIRRFDAPDTNLTTERPGFEIRRGDDVAATIRWIPHSVHGFRIDTMNHGNIVYNSDSGLTGRAYTMHRGDRLVAQVKEQVALFGDEYFIDIGDNEDTVLLLCVAIVIDLVQEDWAAETK